MATAFGGGDAAPAGDKKDEEVTGKLEEIGCSFFNIELT